MTCAPTATRTRDLPLRRSSLPSAPAAETLIGAEFLVLWLPLSTDGFVLVLARGWHGQLTRRRWLVVKILCLQSTFRLSVTVAGLGINLFTICFGRLLSGLVVVRRSGQARDALLTYDGYCASGLLYHPSCGTTGANAKPEGDMNAMSDTNKRNLLYFENRSMRGLYASMDEWQQTNNRRLHSISIQQDGDNYCCIALTNPTEVVITSLDGRRHADVEQANGGRLKITQYV
jgi:hypothetical protein